MKENPTHKETSNRADATQLFENQHFVRHAPRFVDIKDDNTRTEPFRYAASHRVIYEPSHLHGNSSDEVREMSEYEGLQNLHAFLTEAETTLSALDTKEAEERAEEARGLRDGLVYIGRKEFEEAAAGIAARWNAYLEEDPNNRIYVPVHPKAFGEYPEDLPKSSEYVLEHVKGHINEEVAGRVTTDLSTIKEAADHDHTKVVLLDDWSKSGTQIAHAHGHIKEALGDDAHPTIEVNLLAASTAQIENPDFHGEVTLPTYAYFNAGEDTGNEHFIGGPRIAGTHSSVDFDFSENILFIQKEMKNDSADDPVPPPALTNIIRQYRTDKDAAQD